jgi:hypothetical protein
MKLFKVRFDIPLLILAIGSISLGALGCAAVDDSSLDADGTRDPNGATIADAVCTPEAAFDGEPVVAPANEWTWVPVAESRCRDGSSTGFAIRKNPASDKLVIYLQGGGACFNAASCLANPSSFGLAQFTDWKSDKGNSGILDDSNAANPLQDWNAVFIPYCSGDVHTGDATGVKVPGLFGPANQSFSGYANIGHDLQRIVPTFQNMSNVLLTGDSAGGFGALFNFDRVAQAFCPAKVSLIDDSGLPLPDTYLAACLQERWRTLWNINANLPADCTDCNAGNGGGLVNMYGFLGDKYATSRLGVVGSNADAVISLFYGWGRNECANIDGLEAPLNVLRYGEGLRVTRDQYLKRSPAWGSYYITSLLHTWIGRNAFYTRKVRGVSLLDCIVNGDASRHVAP